MGLVSLGFKKYYIFRWNFLFESQMSTNIIIDLGFSMIFSMEFFVWISDGGISIIDLGFPIFFDRIFLFGSQMGVIISISTIAHNRWG